MVLDEETRALLTESIDEAFAAFVDDQAIKFWEGGIVRSAPTGAPPEYITVEVEGIYDENVMWRGVPPTPAVGDEVLVWENPITHRREIVAASGATGVTGGASWCQVVVVAKCGGDFDDITEAITWINALAAGPAANKLYVLYVLAGNWIEGANITVPSFVTLRGMGDGTSIEMGAFDLIMSDDSNLLDVKVTFAAGGMIDINNADRIILEHVHGMQTSNDDVLWIRGNSSDVECKDCWFESTGNEAVFIEDDVTAILLDNCRFKAHSGSGYALVIANWAVVTTLWCQFEAYVPVATYNFSTWNHFGCQLDLSACTLLAGGHIALSGKRFNQTLIVAEAGGEFTSLGAAITYINAQGDAAAAKLYGILILTGNFAEAADVTVPSYVHVMGMGEGTEIEMAATFTLTLSSHSSLRDVVIEGNTDATEGVIQIASGASNVILRNVRSIQSNGAGYCYYADGDAYQIWFYECRAEGSAGADGFVFEGASAVLDNCEANHGNLANGLLLLHASDAIITRYCAFAGTADAVNTLAGSSWSHFMCQFDPDNSTIAGTETPLVTGKANFDDVVTFENGFAMDGLTTQNIITVPTALASALELVDTNAVKYLLVDSAPQLRVQFNPGLADIDFIVSATGVVNALFIGGATGSINLDGPSMTVTDDWWIGFGPWSGRLIFDSTPVPDQVVLDSIDLNLNGNDIIVPDNVAQAMNLVDAGGLEYMRIVSTDAQPVIHFNAGEADIDTIISASGITNALVVQGNTGNVGVGRIPEATLDVQNTAIFRINGTEVWRSVKDAGATGGFLTPAGVGFYISINGTLGTGLFMAGNGRLFVGTGTNPLAAVHAAQGDAAAAVPVLLLDQADISEEMIEFVSTIGVGNAIEAVGAKTLTTTHFIKVTLPGALTRYIPVGTIA